MFPSLQMSPRPSFKEHLNWEGEMALARWEASWDGGQLPPDEVKGTCFHDKRGDQLALWI